MIRAIALDDEPPALRVLTHFCQQVDTVDLIKTFTRTDEALQYLRESPVDLLFLDINMPSISGIDFYRSLTESTLAASPVMVIFTTAYAEYAVEGFTLNAVDYLLKPFTFERFVQAVTKANDFFRWQQRSEPTGETHIFIRADYTVYKIALADILYVEGLDDYLKINLRSENTTSARPGLAQPGLAQPGLAQPGLAQPGLARPIVARLTMKAMLEKLPPEQFVRVHRSFIVPWQRIEGVRNKTILLAEREIPIGASYEADFFRQFKP